MGVEKRNAATRFKIVALRGRLSSGSSKKITFGVLVSTARNGGVFHAARELIQRQGSGVL